MLEQSEKDRRKMFYSAKQRAKANGLPFNLRLKDVVLPDRCPVFRSPLQFHRGKRGDDSPSLDRVRNEQGYVRGNVEVISMRANTIKSNATADELIRVALYAHRHAQSKARSRGRVFLRGTIWWVAFSRHGSEHRVSSRSRHKAHAVALLDKLTGAETVQCVACGAKDFLVIVPLCVDCIERL